jgi:hypothetical protein
MRKTLPYASRIRAATVHGFPSYANPAEATKMFMIVGSTDGYRLVGVRLGFNEPSIIHMMAKGSLA